MCGQVCKHCPFRESPDAYAYDADAMEALEEGHNPACHTIVGADAIFHDAPFDPKHPCIGHQKWVDGETGFTKPEVTSQKVK